MSPSIAREIARRNSLQVTPSRLDENDEYRFGSFHDFLDCYHEVGSVVTQAVDLGRLTEDYLTRVAAEGTVYVEFMLSPDHSIENGITYEAQIEAISEGAARAKLSSGIEARLIITCVRHRGGDAAVALAKRVVANPHPLVVGFGMTGNEFEFSPHEFARAFSLAGEGGLGLTAHTGEWLDGQSVYETVNALDLRRVGHGIAVGADTRLMEYFARRGTGFEVCISSNISLGAASNFQDHPVKKMMAAGCNVTFATDDPAFFKTTPQEEISRACGMVGISAEQAISSVLGGIDMSFCHDHLKVALRKRLALGTSTEAV